MKKKRQNKLVSLITAGLLMVNQLGLASEGQSLPRRQAGPSGTVPFWREIQTPSSGFQLTLPPELGTIQSLHSGSGPTLIHIQTAHGNYEAQKQIQSILHYLKNTYGIKTLFLEGTASQLNPELLRFAPDDPRLTMEIADRLTKIGLVKGSELFLLEEPQAQAYGIEDLKEYVSNGKSFEVVLTQQEKTQGFLRDMDIQIERLTGPYLNKDLRSFLKRWDLFVGADLVSARQTRGQAQGLPLLLDHLVYLKNRAKEYLKIDLSDPAYQIDWPTLLRIFKLKEFEAKLDLHAFTRERDEFLKAIKSTFVGAGSPRPSKGEETSPLQTFDQIKTLLSSPLSQNQLPDPETGLLFERMVSFLPAAFNFDPYPNVKLFIGHLILQSELKPERLFDEINLLTDKVSRELAKTGEEKKLLGLFKDYRLLQRLFVLELTPDDYETLLKRGEEIRPRNLIPHFLEINQAKRVQNMNFLRPEEIESLFDKALEFYEWAKKRDVSMLQNIEKILASSGQRSAYKKDKNSSTLSAVRSTLNAYPKAVVITGGFHAGPFKNYFQNKDYNYALITPRMTDREGRETYIQSTLKKGFNFLETSTLEDPFLSDPLFKRNSDLNHLIKSEITSSFRLSEKQIQRDLKQTLKHIPFRSEVRVEIKTPEEFDRQIWRWVQEKEGIQQFQIAGEAPIDIHDETRQNEQDLRFSSDLGPWLRSMFRLFGNLDNLAKLKTVSLKVDFPLEIELKQIPISKENESLLNRLIIKPRRSEARSKEGNVYYRQHERKVELHESFANLIYPKWMAIYQQIGSYPSYKNHGFWYFLAHHGWPVKDYFKWHLPQARQEIESVVQELSNLKAHLNAYHSQIQFPEGTTTSTFLGVVRLAAKSASERNEFTEESVKEIEEVRQALGGFVSQFDSLMRRFEDLNQAINSAHTILEVNAIDLNLQSEQSQDFRSDVRGKKGEAAVESGRTKLQELLEAVYDYIIETEISVGKASEESRLALIQAEHALLAWRADFFAKEDEITLGIETWRGNKKKLTQLTIPSLSFPELEFPLIVPSKVASQDPRLKELYQEWQRTKRALRTQDRIVRASYRSYLEELGDQIFEAMLTTLSLPVKTKERLLEIYGYLKGSEYRLIFAPFGEREESLGFYFIREKEEFLFWKGQRLPSRFFLRIPGEPLLEAKPPRSEARAEDPPKDPAGLDRRQFLQRVASLIAGAQSQLGDFETYAKKLLNMGSGFDPEMMQTLLYFIKLPTSDVEEHASHLVEHPDFAFVLPLIPVEDDPLSIALFRYKTKENNPADLLKIVLSRQRQALRKSEGQIHDLQAKTREEAYRNLKNLLDEWTRLADRETDSANTRHLLRSRSFRRPDPKEIEEAKRELMEASARRQRLERIGQLDPESLYQTVLSGLEKRRDYLKDFFQRIRPQIFEAAKQFKQAQSAKAKESKAKEAKTKEPQKKGAHDSKSKAAEMEDPYDELLLLLQLQKWEDEGGQIGISRPEVRSPASGNPLYQLQEAWDSLLGKSRPHWKPDPRLPSGYDTAAAPVAYDPTKIPKGSLGPLVQLFLPTFPESDALGITRQKLLEGEKGRTLLEITGSQRLMTDPMNEEFVVYVQHWPKMRYDSLLVSKVGQPQRLTPSAVRAELQWAQQGMVSEFHKGERFIDHLHLHLMPAEELPIIEFSKNFTTAGHFAGINLGTLQDYPVPHIAIASSDLVKLEQATMKLSEQLEDDAQLFHQDVLKNPETNQFFSIFFLLDKQSKLPFGFRTAGLVSSPDPHLTEGRLHEILRSSFMGQKTLDSIRQKFWTAWRKDVPTKTGVRAPDLILTYHGRVAPVKQLDLFIKVAKRINEILVQEEKKLAVEIYGGEERPSDYEKQLASLAEENGLRSLVTFRGPYDISNLEAMYDSYPREKTIYLFTGEQEGFALSLLEAMRMGVASIVPDSGGVQELIYDKETGLAAGRVVPVQRLNEEQKIEKYAQEVLKTLRDGNIHQYGRNAQVIASKFTPELMAAQYYKEFQVLSGVTSGDSFRLQYLSPGLFPYRVGGISEWARNLLMGWARLRQKGQIAPFEVHVASLVNYGGQVTQDSQAVMDQLASFTSVDVEHIVKSRTLPDSALLQSGIKPLLRQVLQKILSMPDEGSFRDRVSTPLTDEEDRIILYRLWKFFRTYDYRYSIQILTPELLNELIPHWADQVGEPEKELMIKTLFLEGNLNFLMMPLVQGDVLYVDSTNPFGLLGVLSKYYTETGARKKLVPFVIGQHGQGAKTLFSKIDQDLRFGPIAKQLLRKTLVFSVRLFYDNTDKVLAVSNAMAQHVQQDYGVPADKLTVIYNGIDFGQRSSSRPEARKEESEMLNVKSVMWNDAKKEDPLNLTHETLHDPFPRAEVRARQSIVDSRQSIEVPENYGRWTMDSLRRAEVRPQSQRNWTWPSVRTTISPLRSPVEVARRSLRAPAMAGTVGGWIWMRTMLNSFGGNWAIFVKSWSSVSTIFSSHLARLAISRSGLRGTTRSASWPNERRNLRMATGTSSSIKNFTTRGEATLERGYTLDSLRTAPQSGERRGYGQGLDQDSNLARQSLPASPRLPRAPTPHRRESSYSGSTASRAGSGGLQRYVSQGNHPLGFLPHYAPKGSTTAVLGQATRPRPEARAAKEGKILSEEAARKALREIVDLIPRDISGPHPSPLTEEEKDEAVQRYLQDFKFLLLKGITLKEIKEDPRIIKYEPQVKWKYLTETLQIPEDKVRQHPNLLKPSLATLSLKWSFLTTEGETKEEGIPYTHLNIPKEKVGQNPNLLLYSLATLSLKWSFLTTEGETKEEGISYIHLKIPEERVR